MRYYGTNTRYEREKLYDAYIRCQSNTQLRNSYYRKIDQYDPFTTEEVAERYDEKQSQRIPYLRKQSYMVGL